MAPRPIKVMIESGGDNLTLTFSPALADFYIYVIDVAEGAQVIAVDRSELVFELQGEGVLHLAQAQVAIEHVVDRDAVQGVDLLAHMGDTPVGGQQAVPGIRGQLTQQQGEQRGFAGAVGTDQAGFVTGVQGQLGVFEKTLRATL